MKMDPALRRIQRQLQQRLLAVSVTLVVVVAGGLALAAGRWPAWMLLGAGALLLAAIGAWTEHWWRRLAGRPLTSHLNRRWPALEDSAQLLLDELPAVSNGQPGQLVKLQRLKVAAVVADLNGARRLPFGAWRSLLQIGAALVGTALLAGLPSLMTASRDATAQGAPVLLGQTLEVVPPTYTGLAASRYSSLDVEVPEGAAVSWQLRFSGAVDQVWLKPDTGETLLARRTGPGEFALSQTLTGDQVYQIEFAAGPDRWQSAPALIRVLRDQPPTLDVMTPARSPLETSSPESEPLLFEVNASDDYGLGAAVILATVAKGDGEGVKFRDVELPFNRAGAAAAADNVSRRLTHEWDLTALGMEPGDELYYRARITDNRQPQPQQSQTSVMMLRWLGPYSKRSLALEGIAIDILPEYFRSQRQIIIDTEKLLAERNEIPAAEGISRSRSLALDQKSLRIRYGQYLGEEYESDIGLAPGLQEPPGELGADHAGESFSEHLAHTGASASAASSAGGHSHGPDPGGSGTTIGGLPDFMADFVHAHDSAEQATLFDTKTRETLKGALAEMWQSELYLHLVNPAKALPYQYQALALLKQVQQANRIYVRRAGFEPPALDEGKRLTGDPEDSADSATRWQADDTDPKSQLLAQLQVSLTLGQPADEDLQRLAAALTDSDAATRARLAVARYRAGNCSTCLGELQGLVWRELQAVKGQRAPANVVRVQPWGGLANIYLAPLAAPTPDEVDGG